MRSYIEKENGRVLEYPTLMYGVGYGGLYLITSANPPFAKGFVLVEPNTKPDDPRPIGMYRSNWDLNSLVPFKGRAILEQ